MVIQKITLESLITKRDLEMGENADVRVRGLVQKEPQLLQALLRCKLEKRLQLIEQHICSRC